MSKLQQIQALPKGKGIQYLLDEACRIFRNPIAMFDTYYALIANTDVVTDDPLWNELISTGTFCMKTQEFFARECFVEDVANADKLAVMKSDKLKYDRMAANVFNRERIWVAVTVIVGCNTPFEPNDPAAFEVFADTLTSEIQDDEHYIAFGRAYHDDIINKLLNRQIDDPWVYTAHVQILYAGFEDYLYLAVVDVRQNDTFRDRLTHFRDLLVRKYPSFKFAIYSDYIIMMISSKNNIFPFDLIFGTHDNPLAHDNIFVGISSGFENLYELHKYYHEAVTALKEGMKCHSDQRVFLHGGKNKLCTRTSTP